MESPITDMRTPTQPAAPVEHEGMSPLIPLILVILLLIIGAWFMLSRGSMVSYDDQGNKITHVEQGSVVAGFPQRFLLETGVSVEESYTIDYTQAGTVLSTARYTSALDLASNINAFGEILVGEGWLVTAEPSYEAAGATNFYGLKGNEQINIVFVPSEAGIEVTISHVLRG